MLSLHRMTKEERILRFKFPERETFTRDEILEVRRMLSRDDDKDESAVRLPTKFVPVGAKVVIFGEIYRCTLADGDILTDPCIGCDLRSYNCTSRVPQCSPFDRVDRQRVWYKLVAGKDGK